MKSLTHTIRHWRILGKKKYDSVLWGLYNGRDSGTGHPGR